MKTAMFALLSLLLFFLVTLGPNNLPARTTAVDSLTILGHATAKIKTADGKVIYIDPFQPGNYSDSADIVLITHQHSDHNQLNLVRRKSTCVVISNAEAHPDTSYRTFTIGSIKVTAVPAYNVNHQRAQCVGFVVEFNGIKLYHAGDTGNIPEMADLTARHLTFCMLPIDGIFTMTPEEATQAASTINASFNIPMHTMPPPDTFSLPMVARFTPPNKIVIRNGESIGLVITAVEPAPSTPTDFELMQNYPNPFNPMTTIRFSLTRTGVRVSLKVFDMHGREVATLVEGELKVGSHQRVFDASGLASGVYFYRLQSGGMASVKKFVLAK
ncbi:MAG: MBL fold metallo-hydrolase [Ignavibacteriae bacterium]|nr:MBL fold metallo-hydrolase [Ignavibacteriota bacterium]